MVKEYMVRRMSHYPNGDVYFDKVEDAMQFVRDWIQEIKASVKTLSMRGGSHIWVGLWGVVDFDLGAEQGYKYPWVYTIQYRIYHVSEQKFYGIKWENSESGKS